MNYRRRLILVYFAIACVPSSSWTSSAFGQVYYPSIDDYLEACQLDYEESFLAETAHTAVNQNSPAGQTTLYVASTQAFVTGRTVIIDEGGVAEEHKTVSSIQPASLTLSSNLAFTHTAVAAHTVIQRESPPVLSDTEKKEIVFYFALKQYEVASIDVLDSALSAIEQHYILNLKPTYVAWGEGRDADVLTAIADVRSIVEYFKQYVQTSVKSGDILTQTGRNAIAAKALILSRSAEAAIDYLSLSIGSSIGNEQVRVWWNSLQGLSNIVTWWGQKNRMRDITAYWKNTPIHDPRYLIDIKNNYQTWTSPAAAELHIDSARIVSGKLEAALDKHWRDVDIVNRAQVVVGILACFGSIAQVATAVAAIAETSGLAGLFAGTEMRCATLSLQGAGLGGGQFVSLGTVSVQGAGAIELATSIAELKGLIIARAVAASGAAAVGSGMIGSGKGIPTQNLQPKGQPPQQPLNSKGDPYPDLKYPEGHPLAGQKPATPDIKSLKTKPADQRANWSKPGPKTGPIKGRQDYIKYWRQQQYPEPPGGLEKWLEAYELHHITPIKFGGQNVFENLIPVLKGFHRSVVTPWWARFKPGI